MSKTYYPYIMSNKSRREALAAAPPARRNSILKGLRELRKLLGVEES